MKFDKPIMTPFDKDVREHETITLYKSDMFIDDKETIGHKYVNAYNAKGCDGIERIFLAVSDDGVNWKRYGNKPIIDEGKYISGDPQIVKIDDLYVMFFFRYEEKQKPYNTFACSENLTDWTVWKGEPLIKPEYDWENLGAHKSWVVNHNGVVYHYYCAINDKKERFVSVAVSQKTDDFDNLFRL